MKVVAVRAKYITAATAALLLLLTASRMLTVRITGNAVAGQIITKNRFQSFDLDGLLHILPVSGSAFTLSEVLELCHGGYQGLTGLTITPNYAIASDSKQNYLSKCFPLETATSQGGRSMGHCSDFAQYIVHGGARLADENLLDAETAARIAENCPQSMFLHGEFPIESLINQEAATNLWMPNVEQVDDRNLNNTNKYASILCKVKVTCDAFNKYLSLSSASPKPKTLFMSHSSPDTLASVHEILGEHLTLKQDFSKFIHAYGKSGRKRTLEVLQCWLKHHEWGTLSVIGEHPKEYWEHLLLDPKFKFGENKLKNIQIYSTLSIAQIRALQYSSGVHVCPSNQEGYGHYINEARALGALVLTTDHPPMNEFVENGVSGILVGHDVPTPEDYQAMAPYFVSPVAVYPDHICEGIERIMKLSIKERKEMGRKARARYVMDTAVMAKNIKNLVKDWNKQ